MKDTAPPQPPGDPLTRTTEPDPAEAPAGTSPDGAVPPTAPALGRTAVRGFAWMLAQTLGSKAFGLIGQLVLAWLLAPEAFGLVVLAYTVSVFTAPFEQTGLRDVLVHRHRHFRRWATPAFWMSLAIGLGSALFLCAAAPLAAAFYEQPVVIPLLLILAIAAPLNHLSVVPLARLSGQMRFRLLAQVNLFQTFGQTSLTILFALWGLGPFSFVLPRPIMALLVALTAWIAARPPIRLKPMFRRWRFLGSDTGLLVLASFLTVIAFQCDYIVLGRLADPVTVGLYFYAFQLSLQATVLLTGQLPTVLFPVFTRLVTEPARQLKAFHSTISLLAIVTVPVCVLQALAAYPLIALLPERWGGAALLLLVLSLGSAFRIMETARNSLLQSQGRFAAILWLSVLRLALFMPLVLSGWFAGGVVGVAIAFTLGSVISAGLGMTIALRPLGASAWVYWLTILPPLALAGVVALPAWGAGLLAGSAGGPAADLVVRVLTFGVLLGALWWWLYREPLLQTMGLLLRRPVAPGPQQPHV